jgi:integrase
MSKMVFDRPHHVLGWWTPGPSDWDFLYQRFSLLVRNEACQFRNQQSRTALKWRSRTSNGRFALHPLLLFLYTTGSRVTAAMAITWSQIEEDDEKMYVRLPGVLTKNKEPLLLRLTTELADLLRGMKPEAHVLDGTNLRRAWDAATISIGQPDLLLYDLRRSGARNLRRARVPESVIMKIGGWKTAAMFRRYGIVATDELDTAMDA